MLKMQPLSLCRQFSEYSFIKQVQKSNFQTFYKGNPFVLHKSISQVFILRKECILKRIRAYNACMYSTTCLNESSNDTSPDSASLHSETKAANDVANALNFLISCGLSPTDIQEKCMKYIKSSHNPFVKILNISKLHPNILLLMPLMSLSLATLRAAAVQASLKKLQFDGFSNRIEYLSHHFETEIEELIPCLTVHFSLLTMPFARLDDKMRILKEAGIGPEHLVKDLWIFNYHEMFIRERISVTKKAQVQLKPWMIRSSEKNFENMIVMGSETHRILQGEDANSYLARKFNCSEDYVEFMMQKNKQLKSINIPKLEQVINFLYEKGYAPQEIRLCPRILCASVQTLSERLSAFQKYGIEMPPLNRLCTTKKIYKSFIEQQKKTNKS